MFTKRHDEINALLSDPTAQLKVVEFQFSFGTEKSPHPVMNCVTDVILDLSRQSARRCETSSSKLRLVNHRNRGKSDERIYMGADGSISTLRLFNICPTRDFSWSLITTQEYAEADLKRLISFAERRLREYKRAIAESGWRYRSHRSRRSKLPGWLIGAVENNPKLTTEAVAKATEIKKVHTSCRDCIFAVYNGKTQIGCDYNNRLSQFESLEVVVGAFDEEKEFYVINGRSCSPYRNQEYLNKSESSDQSLQALVKRVREEIATRIDYIIVLEEGVEFKDILQSINSVNSQSLKPHSVIIANNQLDVSKGTLLETLQKFCTDTSWYLVTPTVLGSSDSAVDEAFKKCSGHFYVRLLAGVSVPPNVGRSIDVSVTDKLNQFAVLQSPSIEVIHTPFHKFVNGNAPIRVSVPAGDAFEDCVLHSLSEKAAFYEEAQNTTGMLRELSDVCK